VGPDNTVRWDDEELGRKAFGLVDEVLRGVGESGSIDLVNLPPLAATLDTRAFFESAGGWGSKHGPQAAFHPSPFPISCSGWWTSTDGCRVGRAPGST
jgi:hypothetical protein